MAESDALERDRSGMSKAGRRWTADELDVARSLRADDRTYAEIGERLSRSPRAVYNALSKARREPAPAPRGVSTYSSEQLAAELRRRGWICEPTSTPRRRAEVQAPSYGGTVSL